MRDMKIDDTLLDALGERWPLWPVSGNRLNILTSLGAAQKLAYGRYRLTPLGEQMADQWRRRPAVSHSPEEAQDQSTPSEDDLELLDLAIW